jgi:hypothetical protein
MAAHTREDESKRAPAVESKQGRVGTWCSSIAPLLGFVGDQLSELSRRSQQRHAAEVSDTGLTS